METTTQTAKCPFAGKAIPDIDFSDSAFIKNPFATYAAMRDEAPVHRVAFSSGQPFWLITRYEDAMLVFKDPRFTKDIKKTLPPDHKAPASPLAMSQLFSHHVLYMDPPDHTRMKQLVQKAFTPKLVEGMRSHIQDITNDLLDKHIPAGRIDIINDYALPLPISIISGLLGIPEKDQQLFRRWSNIILNIDINVTREERMQMMPEAIGGFTNYLREIFASKQEHPADDLITHLVQAKEGSDKLNETELMSTVFLLFAAGYETSVNLIGNGVLALLQYPEQQQALRNDPALINTAIDEVLRLDPPVSLASERYTLEDVEMNGVTIPKGELVHICITAANRDPRRFDSPDAFDITRKDNKHLSFGQGTHYCVGSALGKLEGEIAINTLLRRIPAFSVEGGDVDALKYKNNSVMRGLEALPIVF